MSDQPQLPLLGVPAPADPPPLSPLPLPGVQAPARARYTPAGVTAGRCDDCLALEAERFPASIHPRAARYVRRVPGAPARFVCYAHLSAWRELDQVGLDASSTLTGRHHPATSHQAAAAVLPTTSRHRRRVLALLALAPSTDDELQDSSGLGANTCRPRRVELVRLGMAEDSGQRRGNRNGNQCIVWRITSTGRDSLTAQAAG